MADTPQKILRIGILQGSTFVEERLLRRRHTVSVGQDAKNTFAILDAALPATQTVFEWTGGAFHLRFNDAMTGKLGVGQRGPDGGAVHFSKLKTLGLARPHPDGGFSIALSQTSRGQVKLGDVTVLFQFVDAPPAPSRLQLPKAVRGGLVNTLDWPFVTTLLASFAVQVFAVAFIVTQDYPEAPRPEIADRFLNPVLLQIQPPATTAAPASEAPDEKADPDEPADAPAAAPRSQAARTPTPKTAERRMQAGVKKKTFLGVIGSNGDDPSDVVENILGDGASIAAMNTAFDGAGLAVNEAGERDRRRDVKAIGATANLGPDTLAGKGLGDVRVATGRKAQEVRVRGKFIPKRIKSDDIIGGSMSPEGVSSVIRRRGRAVRACYEKALGRNNRLGGKVVLRFVVQESGRVSSVKVAQNTLGESTVAACLARGIKRWRFPKPQGGPATIEFPFVLTPAN